jgi:hypothetical protein
MKLSEVIEKLQEILDKEGDSDLLIDVPERHTFVRYFDIVGKRYIGNYWTNRKPDSNSFIIIEIE